MNFIDFNLYLITDRLNLPAGTTLLGQVESALRGGLKAVQLREKDLAPEELLPLAQEMRQLTSKYGASLLINSSLETALEVEADGVHLPSDNPPIMETRKRLGPQRLIGVSTHSLNEIKSATTAGADFVTFGPVYSTPSKIAFGKPLGLTALGRACAETSRPVFALGGITPDQIPALRQAGCFHFACIGAILQATDPTVVTRSFLSPSALTLL